MSEITKCEHPDFEANVTVNRLEDSHGFMADITIKCAFCEQPFQFMGVPMGLNMGGVSTDPLKTELRAAIKPAEVPSWAKLKLSNFIPDQKRET
jgi:hypothetical protein